MAEIENPNRTIKEDINFVFLQKCITAFVKKLEKKCSQFPDSQFS